MDESDLRLLPAEDMLKECGLKPQNIRFTANITLDMFHPAEEVAKLIMNNLQTRAKIKVRLVR